MAKCRNVPLARRRKFRAQPRLLSVGYATEFAQALAPKTRAAVRDGADRAIALQAPSRCVQPLRKIGFEAGEFRPRLLRLSATRAFAVRGCLYEIVYDTRRIVPCSCFAAEVCDFFPPFRGVFAAHHVLPLGVNCTRYMHNRGDIMCMMYMLRMYIMYMAPIRWRREAPARGTECLV